jgi:hypothetical protein
MQNLPPIDYCNSSSWWTCEHVNLVIFCKVILVNADEFLMFNLFYKSWIPIPQKNYKINYIQQNAKNTSLPASIEPTVMASTTLLEWLEPVVLLNLSLLARGKSRQWYLEHHCRVEPQAGSDILSITTGSSHKPAVMVIISLSARSTNWQCWLNWTLSGCVKDRQWSFSTVPVFKNRQWYLTLITVGLVVLVQNPAVIGGFEPTILSRSGVVFNSMYRNPNRKRH